MTTITISREQHLEHIVAVLAREFEGVVPADDVAAEVTHTYDTLCDSSRVEAFIPILALRRARATLRDHVLRD